MRNNAGAVILIILGAFLSVSYAAFWEKNETMEQIETASPTAEAPWPGTAWLGRVASSSETEYVDVDSKQSYSSAYEAVLYGKPADLPCRNFNAYINSFVIPPQTAGAILNWAGIEYGHYILCYLRNFVLAMLVYYGTALVFHYHCYIHPRAEQTFANRERPSKEIIWDQIKLAQASLFLYTLLPVFDEWLIESGYTKVYYTMAEVGGWPMYILCTCCYFACVEIGIYWMHRTLHTNKFLYKHVHMLHHKYNSAHTLTPWASIAFHPLDGILQASPYVAMLPFIPVHYLTHIIMLFFTAIWATYIHDAMDWNVGAIMGSKYHTIHHTHYIYNYGQVFVWCDQFFGTFKEPSGPTGVKLAARGNTLTKTSRMKKRE